MIKLFEKEVITSIVRLLQPAFPAESATLFFVASMYRMYQGGKKALLPLIFSLFLFSYYSIPPSRQVTVSLLTDLGRLRFEEFADCAFSTFNFGDFFFARMP